MLLQPFFWTVLWSVAAVLNPTQKHIERRTWNSLTELVQCRLVGVLISHSEKLLLIKIHCFPELISLFYFKMFKHRCKLKFQRFNLEKTAASCSIEPARLSTCLDVPQANWAERALSFVWGSFHSRSLADFQYLYIYIYIMSTKD